MCEGSDEKERSDETMTVSFPAGNDKATVTEESETPKETDKEDFKAQESLEESKAAETEKEHSLEKPDNPTAVNPSAQPDKETVRDSQSKEESAPAPQEPEAQPEEPVNTTEAAPETTAPPKAETVSEPPNEPEKPKSAYDYAFDVNAIRQELTAIGTGMGLTVDDSLTPNDSSWANPVTASESFQGSGLERCLKDYVSSMPSLITAYGGEPIQYFSIYVENLGGGSYRFYFLY